MEHGLHLWVLNSENCQRDRPHRSSHQLLSRIVQSQRSLEKRERHQPIIEEKVYSLIVEAQDKSFEKIDEIVRKLIILIKFKLKCDQLGQERTAKQVEQMRLLLDVLHQNRDCLDHLDLNQSIFKGQKARQVPLTNVFFNKLLKVDRLFVLLTID